MFKTLLVSSALASMLLVGNLHAKNHTAMQNTHKENHSQHEKMHLVKKVVAAVSKTGLNSDQVAKITEAIDNFKAVKRELKKSKMFPIDALKDDKFDTEVFVNAKSDMFNKKMQAVSELFTSVYSVLTPEQRVVFKREFTAPIVEKMIKKGMTKHHSKNKSCH